MENENEAVLIGSVWLAEPSIHTQATRYRVVVLTITACR